MDLTHCTLTGVDEATPPDILSELSETFPFVEWGFLYSPSRQGQPGRYPSIDLLADAFEQLPGQVRVALHVCGNGVHRLLEGQADELGLVARVAARGGRVQLNFNQARDPVDLARLARLLAAHPGVTFITQMNTANQGVWEAMRQYGAENHAVLFDASGGRGIVCEEWPQPLPGVACGYAGGLGPDNLGTELDRISAVVGPRPLWVDMEGKLRRAAWNGADWLNLDACRACLGAVQTHQDKGQA